MENKKYVQQIIKAILHLDLEETEIIFAKNNDKNQDSNNIYFTIYNNVKIKNPSIDIVIENAYPLIHTLNLVEYKYDNVLAEEVEVLRKILVLLGVNVIIITDNELNTRMSRIREKHEGFKNLLNDLILKAKELKLNSNSDDFYSILKQIKSIEKDLKKSRILALDFEVTLT